MNMMTEPQDRPRPDTTQEYWAALDPEPPLYDVAALRQFVVNAVTAGASDVTLQTDQPPRCEIAGRQFRAGRRPLTPTEMETILIALYGAASAPTLLAGRKVLDFSWSIALSRSVTQRFRVNATGILARRGGAGIEITARALPRETPTLEQVGIPPDLLPLLSPPSGMVIVAGATGQGKSTTLAAILREQFVRRVKIVDIQAPIEFAFTDIDTATRGGSSLGQSEVGTHIESFADGVRSALRRAPDILVIGEIRDSETARAAVDAAMTGHLVYTTIHAGDVPEIFRRFQALLATESGERNAAVDILQTFKVGVAQRLLRSAVGLNRYPVREMAVLAGDLRRTLTDSPPDQWPAISRRFLSSAEPGNPALRPYSRDLARLRADGRVSEEEIASLELDL
ncbi:MAG: ATPase, T2SS/T4P/T4SS family [Rhodobacteraceae bacterium]|nr:ATPase, T2SS/T4P/T4SS family [Paracoccaceae bacterium]MCY4195470.1 ATPase, T2SS/T4P/T4SS family [Paracoccaceae bacterium]MCY4326565.1 ATPase, T2SS/T4P/T4SS family [Paracoccaceae bacterium]